MQSGDVVEVRDRPDHGVTIGELFAGVSAERARAVLDAGRPVPAKVRVLLDKALARG